jgi:hypothetical protein
METPKTTREHIEEAVTRLIREDVQPAASTWQMVKRFFTGQADRARVAVICGAPVPVVRGEDGSIQLAEAPVVVRITSRVKDAANDGHAELVAQIVGDLAEGAISFARLNTLMADVSTFKAVYAEPDGEVDCRIDGNNQVTEIRTRIGIVPSESAATVEA